MCNGALATMNTIISALTITLLRYKDRISKQSDMLTN